MKKSRIVYLSIMIAYALVVMGATVYSLTAYQDNLPWVELIRPDKGRVPKGCLSRAPDGGMQMNTVERQEGPWGQRYVVKQVYVYAYQELPDGNMYVYEALSNENPIIAESSAEYLYDGMEVCIRIR